MTIIESTKGNIVRTLVNDWKIQFRGNKAVSDEFKANCEAAGVTMGHVLRQAMKSFNAKAERERSR